MSVADIFLIFNVTIGTDNYILVENANSLPSINKIFIFYFVASEIVGLVRNSHTVKLDSLHVSVFTKRFC